MSKNSSNRIRTPKSVEKNKSQERIIDNQTNDSESNCKIHLAEVYLSKKRIDLLTTEIEEKEKNETILKEKIEEIESQFNNNISSKLIEINDYKILSEQLMKKLQFIEKTHEYNDLIIYYEEQIEQLNIKNKSYIRMFTNMINKFNDKSISRDEVWRKVVNNFKENTLKLENEITNFKKFERKLHCREKFFEKYSVQTENKIEKLSKLEKENQIQEKKLKELLLKNTEIEKNLVNLTQENTILTKKLSNNNEEMSTIRKYISEIQPILKVDWNEIKSTNISNYGSFVKSNENMKDFKSHKIILLMGNLKEFLENIQNNDIFQNFNISPIFGILDNLKEYVIVLLRKIQNLTLNQYHIINICCELNEKLQDYGKKNKESGLDFLSILKDLRNCCSKLLFDYHPEKTKKKY